MRLAELIGVHLVAVFRDQVQRCDTLCAVARNLLRKGLLPVGQTFLSKFYGHGDIS